MMDDMTTPSSEAKTSWSPLVAGYSIDHKTHSLHVSGWDKGKTKKSKYDLNVFFS